MKNKKIEKVLVNAISALAEETYDQYEDHNEWLDMMYEHLNSTKEELDELGIKINVDGTVEIDFNKEVCSKNDLKERVIKPFVSSILLYDVASAGIDCFFLAPSDDVKNIHTGNRVIFVNKDFSTIMLPHVYEVEKVEKNYDCRIFTFRKDAKINMEKADVLLKEFKNRRNYCMKTRMADIKLDTCPICEKQVLFLRGQNEQGYFDYIHCKKCDLDFRGSVFGAAKEELAKEWNDRGPKV